MVVAAFPKVAEPRFAPAEKAYRLPAPSRGLGAAEQQAVVILDREQPSTSPVMKAAVDAGVEAVLLELVERAARDSRRYPKSGRLLVTWGLALLNAGKFEASIELLQRAEELMPKNGLAKVASAQALARVDKADEGIDLLRSYLRTEDDTGAEFALGQLLLGVGNRPEEAVRHWNGVAERYPQSGVAQFFLGVALLVANQKRTQESIHHLRSAVLTDPRSAVMHHALGVAYAIAGRPIEAANESKVALHLRPTMVEALEVLIRLLVDSGKLADAHLFLATHTNRYPQDTRGHELYAWVRFEEKDYAGARSELHRALSLESDRNVTDPIRIARILSNLGVAYWNLRDHREAAKLLSRAVDVAPAASAAHWTNLAGVLISDHKIGDARRAADSGLSLFPGEPDLHLARAAVAVVQDEPEKAIEHGQLAIKLGHSARSYAAQGGYLADLPGHEKEAVEILRDGLQRYGDHEMIRNNLAYALLMEGAVEEAASVLDSFVSAPSKDSAPYVVATRALLDLRRGNLEAGRMGYETASQLARDQGQTELAVEVLQKLHLEAARTMIAQGAYEQALEEITAGLSVAGRETFRRQLGALEAQLRPGKSSNP
jgi:tetratricopeptide (TPR) repeat protein